MKFLNRHLKSQICSTVILLSLLSTGCEKKEDKKYIARVNDAFLTEEELFIKADTGSTNFQGKNFEELVRQWVDTEILYQEAVKNKNILDEEFIRIVERSKKELAAAFLLKKAVMNEKIKVSESELRDYFNSNKSDFILQQNAAIINTVKFNNEETAIQFRTMLVSKGWRETLDYFSTDPSLLEKQENKFIYRYQIQPLKLLRVIDELLPGEISIIIETEPQVYTIVQLIDFLSKGSNPEYSYVKNFIKQRYLILKNKLFVQNYIQQLRSKYEIEIIRND